MRASIQIREGIQVFSYLTLVTRYFILDALWCLKVRHTCLSEVVPGLAGASTQTGVRDKALFLGFRECSRSHERRKELPAQNTEALTVFTKVALGQSVSFLQSGVICLAAQDCYNASFFCRKQHGRRNSSCKLVVQVCVAVGAVITLILVTASELRQPFELGRIAAFRKCHAPQVRCQLLWRIYLRSSLDYRLACQRPRCLRDVFSRGIVVCALFRRGERRCILGQLRDMLRRRPPLFGYRGT